MRNASVRELEEYIRMAFPKLRFRRARLADTGEDHAALLLDDRFVFRFPRNREYKKTLTKEIALLKQLRHTRLSVAIPRYEWAPPRGEFGGYRLIRGRKMTRAMLRALPKGKRAAAARRVAAFLSAFHTLDARPSAARAPRGAFRLAAYGTRYRKKRRSVIAPAVPRALLARMDRFFSSTYGHMPIPAKTYVHGDFRDEHILMKAGRIAGVIDFGDAGVSDPAFDFSFLFEYGEPFVRAVYAAYRGPKDARFLERARTHYFRWVIDELYYAIKNGEPARARRLGNILEKNLSLRRFP